MYSFPRDAPHDYCFFFPIFLKPFFLLFLFRLFLKTGVFILHKAAIFQTQTIDDLAVAVTVRPTEVLQELLPALEHRDEPAAGRFILVMCLQVFRHVPYFLRQSRNLSL